MTTTSGAGPNYSNSYLGALLGLALAFLGVGGIFWLVGFNNRSSDGIWQMALGGNLSGIGLAAFFLWLVAGAIVLALEHGRSPAAADSTPGGASAPHASHWLDKEDKPTES